MENPEQPPIKETSQKKVLETYPDIQFYGAGGGEVREAIPMGYPVQDQQQLYSRAPQDLNGQQISQPIYSSGQQQQPIQPVSYDQLGAGQEYRYDSRGASSGESGLLRENDPRYHFKFTDKEVRLGFVKKVYAILATQLTFTSLIILLPLLDEAARDWMYRNTALLVISIVGEIVISLVLICSRGVSRSVPTNYILLGLFTIFEAYLVAFISSAYRPDVILAAVFTTAAITALISVYAWNTKSDFTVWGPMLLITGFAFCMLSLFLMVLGFSTGHWRWLELLICWFAVILFSLYLLYDTQLIMGGKRYEIEIDDYILGAIILYTDIITIFLYLLRIFQDR